MRHKFIPVMLISGLLSAIVTFAGCGNKTLTDKNQYGVRIKYAQGVKIEFPDFTLEFIGERRVTSSHYPAGFLYYDFKVNTGNTEKTVSWTSGTGNIGPAKFELGDSRFLLELILSDKLGMLKQDELVIWNKE